MLIVVAELQPDAILGMDFLSQHECKVDIPAQCLIINSLVVNLWQEGNVPQCCKVAVKEPIIILPESEMLILGVVQRRLIYLFIYLGFYVAFNPVQVISRRVVGRAEETSTYSSLGFCTVNCQPTASNYQLSHIGP